MELFLHWWVRCFSSSVSNLAPYFLWKEKAQEVSNLQESLKPKLRVWYDIERFSGCKIDNPDADANAPWDHQEVFRLAIENIGETPVVECRGVLTEITFVGDPRLRFGNNNWNLAFTPNDWPDVANKTIHQAHPEYLDMLFLEFKHQARVGVYMGTQRREWPRHFLDPNVMFNQNGVYYFKINIVSSTPPISVRVKFTISDRHGESFAELVDAGGL
jgi:hypothetical protein